MAKYFDEVFDGLKRAVQFAADAVALQQQTSELTTQTVRELVAVAAIGAHDEQEDLRVTVARLETLVMDLARRLPPTDARGAGGAR